MSSINPPGESNIRQQATAAPGPSKKQTAAPKFTIPPPPPSKNKPKPASSGAITSGAKLSYAELRALWIANGGDPTVASTMAAIAMHESGGTVSALNNNAKTGDYSVGLWQINYYGNLRGDRTQRYGSSQTLRNNAVANVKAAIDLYNSGGFAPWANTYGNGNGPYKAYLKPSTPEEKAADAALAAKAKSADPNYIDATTDLSIQKSANKAWKTDPWVALDKNGQVQYVAQENAPKGALKYGGQPLTQSGFMQVWKQVYEDTFYGYTGRKATGQEMKKILAEGSSTYALAVKLSQSKDFLRSPTFKQHAPGVAEYIKQKLGHAPSAKMVGKIISENWDQATLDAWTKHQPSYLKGPEYTAAIANLTPVYESIMGKPDAHAEAYLHDAAVNGWTQDALAAKLRSDPAYKYSPEYEAKSVNFLDAMGLFVGARPILREVTPQGTLPASSSALKQLTTPNTTLNPALNLKATLGKRK